MKKAFLVLEDGTVFEGYAFGKEAEAVGECVFTVGGMCGYLETLSDPAYCGQIVVQTFPLIGNYGYINADLEGECALAGYVVRECCEEPSNFRCEGGLDSFLKAKGIPGIKGVDTRALTVHLREHGCMNAKICGSADVDLNEIKSHKIHGAVERVCCKEVSVYPAEGEELYRITAIDCGGKKSFIKQLTKYGATVTVMPAVSSFAEVLATNPQGIFVSSGPADPKDCVALDLVKALFGHFPMLGIGLGHQLMALAAGGDIIKMKYGHRGGSQPVKQVDGGLCYITTQNHGFEVKAEGLCGVVTMVNLNDGGVEAVEYPLQNSLSVQFYPEVSGAPRDGSFVFESFFKKIRGV
ncbi:MAG: glutamine-hydrolyzing carbamoyl-phosphate synthase small subunit [Clostridia bacterium]|nr:glutamine-hydrolyzing carbamoyl-phosphate synthase small subunit [Clostridia bacterium]